MTINQRFARRTRQTSPELSPPLACCPPYGVTPGAIPPGIMVPGTSIGDGPTDRGKRIGAVWGKVVISSTPAGWFDRQIRACHRLRACLSRVARVTAEDHRIG